METTVTGFKNRSRDFFHMATWLEPFVVLKVERNEFPTRLAIFYWSWWLVYAPFIGLFIARISRQ
ncbi:BCCT family transporter [Staphylococcus aureus]